MRVNRKSQSILARAAIGALYRAAEDDKGKGGADEKKEEKKSEVKKIELTAEELEQQKQTAITAALEKERSKAAADKKKADEDLEKKKLEDEKNFKELADKADEKRVKAEQERDAAERRAQLAEVNVQLRDLLAKDHADYLSNAADIMLHVEKKLAADAKPEDVQKLLADEAKAFVERTPRAKQIPGTPSGSVRGKAAANQQQDQTEKPVNNKRETPRRSFVSGF